MGPQSTGDARSLGVDFDGEGRRVLRARAVEDATRLRWTQGGILGSAIGLFALPVIAFVLPTTHDDIPAVAPGISQAMKVEAKHAAAIRANRLQVARAKVEAGVLAEGQVTWRTLFGLEFGTTTLTRASVRTQIDYTTFGGVWASFLAAEFGLAMCVLYLRSK